MKIGLVGRPCVGKSYISKIISIYGYDVLNVDEIGHTVLTNSKAEVVNEFGEKILDGNAIIDRSILSNIVFSDKKSLSILNGIIHPKIKQEVYEWIKKSKNVIVDAALMFEIGLDEFCDYVIYVTSNQDIRLKRAEKRGWTKEKLNSIDSNFMSEEELIILSDYVIVNDDEKVFNEIVKVMEKCK